MELSSDLGLFANQFYGWTRDFGSLDNNSVKPLHSDYNSDLFTSRDDRNRFSNGSNSVQESDGNYGSCYAHIRRTNLLLQNAEKYSASADIAQYVGEAHFFRAYSYFDLLQFYGDAIIITQPLDVTSPELRVAQNDRSEVADFIIEDLETAAPMLPRFTELTTDDAGRISREDVGRFSPVWLFTKELGRSFAEMKNGDVSCWTLRQKRPNRLSTARHSVCLSRML